MEKSTKRKLIIGGSLLVVLGVGGYFLYDYLKKQKAEKDAKKLQEENPVIGGGTGGGKGGGSTGGGSGYTFPFKTTTEGNAFRAWVNDNYPAYALSIQLDRTGSLNSYVQKAWVKYGSEYQKKVTISQSTISVGDKVKAIAKAKGYGLDGVPYSNGGDGGGFLNNGSYAGVVKLVKSPMVVVENYSKPMLFDGTNKYTYALALGNVQKIS
jgi:hypothetical protein